METALAIPDVEIIFVCKLQWNKSCFKARDVGVCRVGYFSLTNSEPEILTGINETDNAKFRIPDTQSMHDKLWAPVDHSEHWHALRED